MKTSAKYVSLIYIIFILLLTVAGSFRGALGDVLYYTAFVIPILIALAVARKSDIKTDKMRISVSPFGSLLTLLGIFPTVMLLLLISSAVTYILSLCGFSAPTPDVSGNLAYVIFTTALIPAILEEILFRYIPVSFIAPYSRRGAVIVSAIGFALVHCSLFQIPYALAAGFIFAVITLLTRSILPSVIIHFVNNTVSIILMRYGGVENFSAVFLTVMGALAAASMLLILIPFRKKVFIGVKNAFEGKCKEMFTFEFVIFITFTLCIAISNLF